MSTAQVVVSAPARALAVARAVIADTGRILAGAGVPLLTLSLLGFAVHGLLIDRAATWAVRNGPLGLSVLIAAVTVRLTLLAACLWFAVRALRLGGRSLLDLVRPTAAESGERGDLARLGDSIRLAIVPMVILYAAWNLVNWDIHSFLVAKFRFTQSHMDTVRDLSNINFAQGGWKAYIPWAVGLFGLKVLLERLDRRIDRRLLDLAIVYCECGWVILGWLVIGRGLYEAELWFSTRELAHWLHTAREWLAGFELPFHLDFAAVLVTGWHWFTALVGVLLTRLLWPLVWIAIIGVLVGWLDTDGEEPARARPASRSARALRRLLSTSTSGIQDKWRPLWRTFTAVLRTGVVSMLTMALLYALLMYAGAWLRELLWRLLPTDWFTSPEGYDTLIRLTEALLQPVRIALLVACFAVVLRATVTARTEDGSTREPASAPR